MRLRRFLINEPMGWERYRPIAQCPTPRPNPTRSAHRFLESAKIFSIHSVPPDTVWRTLSGVVQW